MLNVWTLPKVDHGKYFTAQTMVLSRQKCSSCEETGKGGDKIDLTYLQPDIVYI